MKRISVVGLGYIGLPTAIIAAQAGYDVYGFDINDEKVKRINTGDPIIFEPEISERLWKVLRTGNFRAVSDLQYSHCFIIAVPTPFKENKLADLQYVFHADLQYVFHAAEIIAKRLMPGNLIILESTVPVGTTQKLALYLEDLSGLKIGIDFFLAFCPERVLPGKIFKEITENDRIIGGFCQQSCNLAYKFYSKFVTGLIHITDDKTAEMVKLVENASRDVQLAYANQVAAMCTAANIDPYNVIELANKHPRVKILTPTCGVGGHCIAIDPLFLIESFPQETELLQTARKINNQKPQSIVARVLAKVDEARFLNETKPKVLALGVTFKPDVDDIRESPALFIAKMLQAKNDVLDLLVYDHNVSEEEMNKNGLTATTDLWQAITWADIVLILVKHKEFTLLRIDAFGTKSIIDTCGLLYEMQQKQSRAFLDGATKISSYFLE